MQNLRNVLSPSGPKRNTNAEETGNGGSPLKNGAEEKRNKWGGNRRQKNAPKKKGPETGKATESDDVSENVLKS